MTSRMSDRNKRCPSYHIIVIEPGDREEGVHDLINPPGRGKGLGRPIVDSGSCHQIATQMHTSSIIDPHPPIPCLSTRKGVVNGEMGAIMMVVVQI